MFFKCLDGIFIERSCKNNGRGLIHQLQHFKTIDLWHLYIQEYEVRLMLHDGLDAFKSIIAFLNKLYFLVILQVFFYYRTREWFIIYYYCLDHACGIFKIVVKIFLSAMVLRRSFLPNNRYKRRWAELKPKPVPCLGTEVSGSKGFCTEISSILSVLTV